MRPPFASHVLQRLVPLALVLNAGMAGCSSHAVGVGACRRVEEARCRAATACPGVDLSVPRSADNPVASCVRYYHDACLRGLVASAPPSTEELDLCVGAIQSGDCALVKAPETSDACAWMRTAKPK